MQNTDSKGQRESPSKIQVIEILQHLRFFWINEGQIEIEEGFSLIG